MARGKPASGTVGGAVAPKKAAGTALVSAPPAKMPLPGAIAGSELATNGIAGAAMSPRYHEHKPDIVGVDVDDLEEFKSSSLEEFGQFAFGEFLVAGAFWLGFERAITTPDYQTDLLFWVCVVSCVAGLIIGAFGLRQMIRRHRKIDKIIGRAKGGNSG